MIPKAPLRPNETYSVLLRGQIGGEAWQKAWTFTTGSAGPPLAQTRGQALERINAYRRAAGLSAVAFDTTLNQGCQTHSEYLARNLGVLFQKKLSFNDEDPDLDGYSVEGKRTAQQSNVFLKVPEPTFAIDDVMGTFLRRSALLNPQLQRVGFGCANDVGRGWHGVLDLAGGRGGDRTVIYPVDQQEGIPCASFDRLAAQKDALGFPISVMFPAQVKLLGGKGTLTDADGNTVESLLITSERPLDGMVLPRPGLCLYPRAPLRSRRTYHVTMSAVVNGKQWRQTWQFTTE
jgi:hypothetical protein